MIFVACLEKSGDARRKTNGKRTNEPDFKPFLGWDSLWNGNKLFGDDAAGFGGVL
jgi:hypothetical protein